MTKLRTGRLVFSAATLFCAALAAPGAHAQQTAFDITLRSIAPATINPSAFDGRLRQTVLSIAPATLENQPGIVPAVYDPAVGRFVSAVGTTRGAIAVTSSGAVSVIVSNQNGSLPLGGIASGIPLRSETVSGSSAAVTTQQVTTTPAASSR